MSCLRIVLYLIVLLVCLGLINDEVPTAPLEVLWSTSHETGDLKDWEAGQSGKAVFNTASAYVEVSTEEVHSGEYALKMEVWDIDRETAAARIFRWDEFLTEGYFSCWLMFPELPQVNGWFNVFQFKKKDFESDENDPTWYNEIKNKSHGTVLTLTHWNQEWDIEPNVNQPPPLQPYEWFHLEWYYRDGIEDGAITIWQDGIEVWDLYDIDTRGLNPHIQWAPNVYGNNVEPGHLVMYVDDCAISTSRVGTDFFEVRDLEPLSP